jgi:hypothetical protein
MPDEKRADKQNLIDKIITILLQLPWSKALTELQKIARRAVHRRSSAGMYEARN